MLVEKGEMPPSITSDELNYLVFRYLQESGLTHAAFALGYEAGIDKCPIDGHMIPPGTLVKIVQKGLQYIEMEANSDVEADDDFTFVEPLELITMDVHQLRRVIKEKKENLQNKQDRDKERENIAAKEKETEHGHERDVEMNESEKEQKKDEDKTDNVKEQVREKEREKKQEEHKEMEPNKDHEDKMKIRFEDHKACGGPEPMEILSCSSFADCEVPSSHVTVLKGHTSEVFACAWSPMASLLASGSGDSTARIWCLPHGPNASNTQTGVPNAYVLKHFKGRTNEKSKDVTTLDWKGDGTLLASGSYDGNARIWGRDGELKNTLSKHKGPIFSLKWNKKGDYLLSGSVDKTAIVWDTKTGECKQQFEFHSAPTLDVDWRNDVSFATCSTDHMIYVCKIGENRPIKAFSGHQGEVNAIKWDPTGSLLASCSDDHTAKIWSLKHDKFLHDLNDHDKEIYTIRWSPTGPRTCNPNQQLVLASASFDSTIKLWDAELGKLLYSLRGHRQPVYSVAFSPNGEYLASGSLDQSLHIWSIKQGKVVKTYSGGGGIFEVCWNGEGDKIAACFSNNTVCVVDFRM